MKYYKADDVIRKYAEMIADEAYWEHGVGNGKPDEEDLDIAREYYSDLPTIEVSEKVEDERCKGCKHYKLACDLFSEICKYEPITQTETQNSNLTFEIADTPKAKVSEDCISREWVKGICEYMLDEEMLGHMLGHIEDAPSVVPKDNSFKDGQKDMLMFLLEGMKNALEKARNERIEE